MRVEEQEETLVNVHVLIKVGVTERISISTWMANGQKTIDNRVNEISFTIISMKKRLVCNPPPTLGLIIIATTANKLTIFISPMIP